jgi:hypothetical protein
MAFLAGVLGSTDELRMDPITDSKEALAAFMTLPEDQRALSGETDPVRRIVLEGVLPAPHGGVSAHKLQAFKDAHGHLLADFRREIERRVLAAASLRDARFAAEQARLDRQELGPQIDEIERRMSEPRWGWRRIGVGTVASVAGG